MKNVTFYFDDMPPVIVQINARFMRVFKEIKTQLNLFLIFINKYLINNITDQSEPLKDTTEGETKKPPVISGRIKTV